MKFLKRVFLLSLTFLLMSSLLLASIYLINDQSRPRENAITRPVSTAPKTTPAEQEQSTKDEITLKVEEIRDNGLLRLVNSQYATKEVRASRLSETANGKFQLREDILHDVNAFLAYAKKENNGLYFTSAFRTIKEQTEIYRKTANKGLVQKPGYSEHHTGLALDLVPLKGLEGKKGIELLSEQEFMAEHSWKYGLIKRYPEGKEAVTGIDHEFWHFRYVGKPHAAYIHSKGLVLEEYLEHLETSGELEVGLQGETYAVYWRKAINGMISFPKSAEFEISSTNTGAWIITVPQN